ncbi:MAG: hypothetical protein ICV84_00215, partial [Flavisolibacter sp.]|nr:hypothetical protein [Flavisolibacter sp.]
MSLKIYAGYWVIALAVTILSGCKKEDPAPVIETIDVANSTVLRQGMFVREVHATSGTAKFLMQGNTRSLVLDNFRTDNGPGLYVYLSADRS